VVLAVLVALVIGVFGWDKAQSYGKAIPVTIQQQVDNKTPMVLEKNRIQVLIGKANSDILIHQDKICELQARRDTLGREIDCATRKLCGEMELLKRIKEMLAEKCESYVIGCRTYSFAEVNSDALERVKTVERLQEDITFRKSLGEDLDRGIRQGQDNLVQTRKQLAELRNLVERLETREATANIRLELARLTDAATGSPLSQDSELEKAIANYTQRITHKERQAEFSLTNGNGQSRIDYTKTIVSQDAIGEIDKILNPSQQPENPGNLAQPSVPSVNSNIKP
jgi:chromosome segregation ATPase